jgi:hypothetical protein
MRMQWLRIAQRLSIAAERVRTISSSAWYAPAFNEFR